MTSVLEVQDLVVEYHQRSSVHRSIDSVSLIVEPGEILGLVGESGAGKSVFVRSLLNIERPPGRIVGGSVKIFGQNVLAMSDTQLRTVRGRRVGVIVQNARAHLNPLIRIGDQIANAYTAHHKEKNDAVRARVIQLLQDVGMPAAEQRYRAYPHELSGGMAQRAMIAMAMVCEPELLIADEPTNGLDVTIQDQILRLFRRSVTERGASGLLVSRDMGIVANFCDRVAVMHQGQIVELAKVSAFFKEAAHPQSLALISAASYKSASAVEGSQAQEVSV